MHRTDIEQLTGIVVLEFGASWCGYCKAAQPDIAAALESFPRVQHIKIEDGKGQRLGRSYIVKLWPTLIFLQNGIEMARLVRPSFKSEIVEVLQKLEHP